MTVMICGSIAYDTVMVFDGRFKEHILPDSIHMLSVSFLVPQMRRNFGGVAGNIAYNLSLLGIRSEVLATVASTVARVSRTVVAAPTRSGVLASRGVMSLSGRPTSVGMRFMIAVTVGV